MHSGIGVSVPLAFTATGMSPMVHWLLEEFVFIWFFGRFAGLRLDEIVFRARL